MRKKDILAFILIIGITILVIALLFNVFTSSPKIDSFSSIGGQRVGVIELNGPIYKSRPFVDNLKKLLDTPSVKALVVRIDSPGGTVGASQEISNAVKRASEKIPVVVSMGDIAASGGYYAALGADIIMANPATTTGSIGVIAQVPAFYELMNRIGISQETIKSGEFKDTGNPFRPMTKKERKYLQEWVDDTYEQFLEKVAEERELPIEEVRKIADGRVFTGRQALQYGLVDTLGDWHDAILTAGQLAGIKGEPMILEKKRRKITIMDILFGDLEEAISHLTGNRVELKYIAF
ncbi:signal peptide peptidase SppA [bacterium]|nr:signal peptide peptidase SppA [FCB group bacterium]MBL7190663.1 signal peptide peptidase SppA [bacterium]